MKILAGWKYRGWKLGMISQRQVRRRSILRYPLFRKHTNWFLSRQRNSALSLEFGDTRFVLQGEADVIEDVHHAVAAEWVDRESGFKALAVANGLLIGRYDSKPAILIATAFEEAMLRIHSEPVKLMDSYFL